ncbi:DUF4345 domain-containing protein [Phenylobacterium sp.]|uniref:DUF4345 domain-containing protein n=1 Tax=Phenylobacterium sp. TaxID=1871053 RepID=UPI0011F8D0AD|nr:DUF4345 domain-containing protein [Phenylobacterium sp.]THD59068.1 MAG: DUF4345 domain-containing protein [Phenylobacterium sp.]
MSRWPVSSPARMFRMTQVAPNPRTDRTTGHRRMMRVAMRFLLAGLGGSALLIALSILLLGAGATAGVGERAFEMLSGWKGLPSPSWPPSTDSELRFYSALWGGYGVMLLCAARNLSRWDGRVPGLAAIFFIGGVGRALSWVMVGAPHPFFLVLMAIELILPPVIIVLWSGARNNTASR